jgi:hypothetical protein
MVARGVVAGLAALAFIACGGDPGQTGSAPLVERTAQGPFSGLVAERGTVAHAGERTIEVHDALGLVVAHRERIVTDGAGRFSVRPIEALSSVSDDWEFRQINREGYLFRYRDFAIRNQAQFERNYRLTDLGLEATVAGRLCRHYLVERTRGEARSFKLAVDVASRLILQVEERDADGRLATSMTYTTYEEAPELSTAVWFESVHEETHLAVDDPSGLRPRRLPEGFVPHEAVRLRSGEEEWIRRTYTDGVETVFFLHRTREGRPADREAAAASTGGGLPYEEAEDVLLYRMGAAGVAQALLPEGSFVAVGKLADRALVDLIESALP